MPRPSVIPAAALAGLLSACVPPVEEPPTAAVAQDASPEAAATSPEKKEIKKLGMNEHGEVTSISLENFFILHQSDQAFVIDARPAYFYKLGHIPGAINLPKNGCDPRIEALDSKLKDIAASGKTIVVYCTSVTCADARAVAIHLSHYGHSASIFTGGWKAWNSADMPTE